METSRPEVIFLGTGSALNIERSQASVLMRTRDVALLLDVGGGIETCRALAQECVLESDITHVFLSHRHLDHTGGLESFLLRRALVSSLPEDAVLTVLGSGPTLDAVRAGLAAFDASGVRLLGNGIRWVAMPAGAGELLSAAVRLEAVAANHLPDDDSARSAVVTGPGWKISYSGDSRPTDALAAAARGSDLLIHEVGGLHTQQALMARVRHTTARELGLFAIRAEVRELALFHVPPKEYASEKDLLQEVRSTAPDVRVFLPDDADLWGPTQ